MSKLEIKKLEVELLNVSAAKASFELRIEHAKADIETYENAIVVQSNKEEELKQKLKEIKGE